MIRASCFLSGVHSHPEIDSLRISTIKASSKDPGQHVESAPQLVFGQKHVARAWLPSLVESHVEADEETR